MPAVPNYWEQIETEARELAALLKRRDRPRDEVAKAERLIQLGTEVTELTELTCTTNRTGLYGRTAIDRQSRIVATARFRDLRQPDD